MRTLAAILLSTVALCAQSAQPLASFEFRDNGATPPTPNRWGASYQSTMLKDGTTEIRYFFFAHTALTAFRVTLKPASEPGFVIATFTPWDDAPVADLPAMRDGLPITRVALETYPAGVLLKAEERITLAWSNAPGERRLLQGTLYMDPPMPEAEYRTLRLKRSGIQIPRP